ncbi:hypothetical protein ACVWZL_002374 [Bradyrhizobium sp. GM2.4]
MNDGTPLEVGVKFTSATAGQITALKFYRSPSDRGADLVDLWTATGTKLASASFTNTTTSGWQTVNLATPVTISANTTYIASYHTNGAYVATNNFFANSFTSGQFDGAFVRRIWRQRRLFLRRYQHGWYIPDEYVWFYELLG